MCPRAYMQGEKAAGRQDILVGFGFILLVRGGLRGIVCAKMKGLP